MVSLSEAVVVVKIDGEKKLSVSESLDETGSDRGPVNALSKALAKAGPRLIVDNQTDTFAQVAAGRGVITINSSVGLQAFFHDKPVITLGKAFFAIPGLVTPVGNPEDLARTCAQVESLWYDPDLRAAFMNYLDQVYYPKVTEAADGAWIVDESDARRKLAQAREAAKATPPLSQPGALR